MPRINVSLKDAEARQPLPDDTYECKVLEINPKQGSKSAYLQVIYEVVDGEHEGRKIYDNVMIEGAAAWQFCDWWEALTGTTLDVDDLDEFDFDTDDVVGEALGITTEQEEYPEGSGRYNHKAAKYLAAA